MAFVQSNFDQQFQPSSGGEQGLVSFMNNMYKHTAGGLTVSGIIAYLVYSTGLFTVLLSGITSWIVFLAPLGMILWYSFKGQDWPLSTLTAFYYSFTGVLGLSLSSVFAIYSATSIVEAFLTTTLLFGAMATYGTITKRDLSGLGSLLFFGLIGVIIASLINMFFMSSLFSLIISIVGIIVFLGLTAYDVQTAKQIYAETGGDERYGIKFAISLYLNFINLFQMILSLTGYSSTNND
jgi:FtsH-binding integral membrane protein